MMKADCKRKMIISALTQTSPGRFTVELDGGEKLISTLNTVTDMRLYVGKELDDNAFEELKRSSSRAVARDRALTMLSRRQFSRKELTDKLLRKGEDEQNAEYCVDWLEENGFLNDAEYSAAIVRHYSAKGYGAGRIRGELAKRGIARELWDAALEDLGESSEKLDAYISRRLTDPEDRAEIRRISSALLRRGYSWDEIRSALRRSKAETEE